MKKIKIVLLCTLVGALLPHIGYWGAALLHAIATALSPASGLTWVSGVAMVVGFLCALFWVLPTNADVYERKVRR